MFRRPSESDTDTIDISAQGSLLGEPKETVNVLSPQQAAAYQANGQAAAPAAPLAQPIQSPYSPAARNPEPARPSAVSAPSSFRPASLSEPRRAEPQKPAAPATSSYLPSTTALSKEAKRVLTVGPEILMKGEVTTCDRLVIEGKVDATVTDVQIMELAEGGSFKGTAQVEFAEISGIFEGDLIVKSRLIIYASGKVRGKITYGEIEIERGGELTGEIKTIAGAGHASNRPRVKEAA